jgi:putative ABC transport system substrate-binding protein
LSADIAIIKSNNIGPYNQAIEGFMKEIKTDVSEYDLQGKSDKTFEIIKKIKKDSPRLIFALGTLASVIAKENISNIPIIYTLVLNPEKKGLKGANITGISIDVSSMMQFSVLKKVIPEIKKIGVLCSRLTEDLTLRAQKNCQRMGLELLPVKISRPEDVPNGAKDLIAKVDLLWLIPDSIVVNRDSLYYILLLTLENNIPFMVYNKNFVKSGALLSPVVSFTTVGRQAGRLGRKVFQGKKLPATILPPAQVEWAINLNIANNLGLHIPENILTLFKHVYK